MTRCWRRCNRLPGENLSRWVVAACLSRLLREDVRTSLAWEQQHPAEGAAARTDDARYALEAEAEREIDHHAHAAAQTRGADAQPTTEDYLAAFSQVRALLDQAEQQLRDQQRRVDKQ